MDGYKVQREGYSPMKISRNIAIAISALAITSLPISGAVYAKSKAKKSYAMKKKTAPKPTKNIVETAVATPDLSTLVAAVKAADLVDTLSSPGPFTVFAPTNAAFGKLPAGTVETLVKPENKGILTSILTYHGSYPQRWRQGRFADSQWRNINGNHAGQTSGANRCKRRHVYRQTGQFDAIQWRGACD
jgi:hypothetical protein